MPTISSYFAHTVNMNTNDSANSAKHAKLFVVTVPNTAIDFPELNQHGGNVHHPRHTQSAAPRLGL